MVTAQELASGAPSGLHGAPDAGRCGHRTQLLAAQRIATIAFRRSARGRSTGIPACPQSRSLPALAGHDRSREVLESNGLARTSAGKDETAFSSPSKPSSARPRAAANHGSGSAVFNSIR